ncbi:MAG TPA: CPBP family intramembrane glutamic endopeptidase [Ignavibacteriaceae bacterium]|nr:CPBP family intramembrane glutamic endopeptidase [Ignavibacteriaceae bacterium]
MFKSFGIKVPPQIIDNVSDKRKFGRFALLLIIARSIFLLLSQGIIALILLLMKDSDPWENSSKWWTVYGTITDIGCLTLVLVFLKKEKKKFWSIINFSYKRILKDILAGVLIFIIIFPVTGMLFSMLLNNIIYDGVSFDVLYPGMITDRVLPVWAYYYSLLIWWPIWSFTEEVTYQGYCMPRLIVYFKNPIKVIMLIGFFWALQHCFLPFIPDWRYLLYRLISFFPIVVALIFAYIKTGRLVPIIIAHYLMDFMAAWWTLKHV